MKSLDLVGVALFELEIAHLPRANHQCHYGSMTNFSNELRINYCEVSVV
jgi:hypothetical protein